MKKIILILFLVSVLVSCKNGGNASIEIGDCIFDLQQEASNALSLYAFVYHIDDTYVFVQLKDRGVVEKRIVFSEQRKVIDSGGYDLIKNVSVGELSQYIDLPFENVEECFANAHLDIGSGFYIPSYITEDGYIISFHTDEDIVVDISKSDLFFGTQIEKTWD